MKIRAQIMKKRRKAEKIKGVGREYAMKNGSNIFWNFVALFPLIHTLILNKWITIPDPKSVFFSMGKT